MRILLIYPSNFYSSKWGKLYFFKPHLLGIFSILRREYDTDILDLEVEIGKPDTREEVGSFRKKAFELISGRRFDIVGISCWSSHNYLSSVAVAEICKKVNSKCIVAVGGYHASGLPEDFIYEHSPFDFIIKGEGEYAFLDLCRQIENRRYDISGIERVIQGAPLRLDETMDMFDMAAYKYASLHRNQKALVYLSRGCPYSCSFCMEYSKGKNRMWRPYSVKNSLGIIDDAIGLLRPVDIIICDACFGLNKNWRRQFLKELIKRKSSNIFWAAVRSDALEREDVDLFSKLNFILYIGLETGSERMVKMMKKAHDPKGYLAKSRDIITYLNEKRVMNFSHILVNHPGETYETFKETIRFLKSLVAGRKDISSVFLGQSYFYYPGNYVYDNIGYYEKKYGTIVKNKGWWRKEGNYFEAAYENIPSAELIKKTKDMNYWRKEFEHLYDYSRERLPAEIKLMLLKSSEKGIRF